jgi:hypothetical protein
LSTITISGKTTAWITPYCDIGPDQIEKPDERIGTTSFVYSDEDMTSQGWTVAGKAEITVTLVDRDTLVSNKVDSLRKELTKVRADAQVRANELEGQIQKLLAISYSPQLA